MLQCCQGCGHWHWPAVPRCAECGTWSPQWRDLELRGTVFSWTKVWYRFAGTEGIDLPYTTVLCALPQAGNRRLLGLYEGEEAQLDFDRPLVGRIASIEFAGATVPSIRWRVAS
jgi:uncharacterized OB-fold protein